MVDGESVMADGGSIMMGGRWQICHRVWYVIVMGQGPLTFFCISTQATYIHFLFIYVRPALPLTPHCNNPQNPNQSGLLLCDI
jgi:hypothetical protein